MSFHTVQPVPGSETREGYDLKADLMRPDDYPVLAKCMGCGELIRIRDFFSRRWAHMEVGMLPQREAAGITDAPGGSQTP